MSKKENVKETEFTSYNNEVSENQEHVKRSVNRAIDQTKDNIQSTVEEAKREIPRFTQAVNQYQEQSTLINYMVRRTTNEL